MWTNHFTFIQCNTMTQCHNYLWHYFAFYMRKQTLRMCLAWATKSWSWDMNTSVADFKMSNVKAHTLNPCLTLTSKDVNI